MDNQQTVNLKFYFDPVCPWAWRTSLWIREVQKVRPVQVEWDFFSLKVANSGKESLKDSHFMSEPGFRVMALIRRQYGAAEANALIDRLYLELGQARHDRQEDIGELVVVETALKNVGLDTALLHQAMADDSTLEDVLRSHEEATERGSFGVPALLLPGGDKTTFGPVISTVPSGEEAGQMWDHVSWMMARPDFYELKRSR